MKTFIVKGQNWINEVEINNELFDKYGDMAFEAMTQGLEMFFKGEYKPCLDKLPNGEFDREVGLGWIMMSYEEGYKENPDKNIACLTEYVLVNAGYHDLAATAKEMRKKSTED